MKAVVLVGGFGKRLYPITAEIPKCLVEVSGKPLIYWIIHYLRFHGVKEIILCTHYKHELIRNWLGDGSRFGVNIEYSYEKEPLGTGGALLNARKLLENEDWFYCMNGDILTTIDLKRLNVLANKGVVGVIATVPLRTAYGIIVFGKDNSIERFIEKPVLWEYWMNAGIYLLSNEIFDYLKPKCMLEYEVFTQLEGTGKLKALQFPMSSWLSIETYKDVLKAEKETFYKAYARERVEIPY